MVRRIADFTGKKELMEPDLNIHDVELEDLTRKTREILRREVTNLMVESTGKKLSPTSSQSLVSYIKLLGELKDKEDEELRRLGNDHLKKLSGQE